MTLPDHYPAAVQRPVSYAPSAGLLDQQPHGWVLHVVVGNGSPWGTFEHATSPNRRFSHLWVSKTGMVEQYAPLTGKSWAMAAGNPWWWSVETEGMPSEALTDAQLDALAAWHVWCGAVDRIAGPEDTQGGSPGRGIVTHQDGGAAWGGHACPGPIRAGQRPEILRRAAALRQGGTVALTNADADTVWEKPYTYGGEKTSPLIMLREVTNTIRAQQAQIEALAAAVEALTPKP